MGVEINKQRIIWEEKLWHVKASRFWVEPSYLCLNSNYLSLKLGNLFNHSVFSFPICQILPLLSLWVAVVMIK